MFAVLRRSGGLEALGRKLALEQPVAARGAQVLLPEIMQALRAWLQAAGGGARGADALAHWLQEMGGGDLSVKLINQRVVDENRAHKIVQTLFPDSTATTAMIQRAAVEAGIPAGVMPELLRLLAVLVCGYIAARCEVAAVEGRDMLAEISPLLRSISPDAFPEG